MKTILWLIILLCCTQIVHAAQYVGSGACAKCHIKEYNEFVVSGHPYILHKAEEAKKRPVPLPEGYTWDDISYVIGGNTKKARYVDKNGYMLTADLEGAKIKNQYNIETGTWSYFFPLKKMSYKCAKCHTTGYNKNGHQDNLDGIVGTWVSQGIQCEACHGPGEDHVKSHEAGIKHKLKIDTSSGFCGQCHLRGEPNTIAAKGGLLRNREQFSELLSGPHSKMNCVDCHNQHSRPSLAVGIKKACRSCHEQQAIEFKKNIHFEVGIKCIDCHMPRAGKAAARASKYEGDLRTHLVKINVNIDSAMFSDDGKFAKGGFITLNFACLNCHRDKEKKWASAKAKGMHGVSNIKVNNAIKSK